MAAELWPLGFESRRMRLDRIIQKADKIGAVRWTPTTINLFANGPVHGETRRGDEKEKEGNDETHQEGAGEPSRTAGGAASGAGWYMNLLAAPVKVLFDVFEVSVFRNEEAYLYPSDHFGLVAEFSMACGDTTSSQTKSNM
jgi:hypothetical protein